MPSARSASSLARLAASSSSDTANAKRSRNANAKHLRAHCSPTPILVIFSLRLVPLGSATSTVSPFLWPSRALPTGDSLDRRSGGLASAEPTMTKVCFLPPSSVTLTCEPTRTTSVERSLASMTVAERRRSSSWAIRCSSMACSFLASSYSEFSEISPNSRASLILSATSLRFSVWRCSSSSFSLRSPSGVRMTSFCMPARIAGSGGSRSIPTALPLLLGLLLALAFAMPAAAADNAGVIVRCRPGPTAGVRLDTRQDADVTRDQGLLLPRAEVVQPQPGQSVADAVSALNDDPDVAYAEANGGRHAFATPSDPLLGAEWGLENTGQDVPNKNPDNRFAQTPVADADID